MITLIHVGYLISTTFLLSCVSLTQFIAEYGENLGVAYDIWYHLNSWSKLKLDYKWIVGDWSECSATCARGKLRRMHYKFSLITKEFIVTRSREHFSTEYNGLRFSSLWKTLNFSFVPRSWQKRISSFLVSSLLLT